jgi:hypothetical protein
VTNLLMSREVDQRRRKTETIPQAAHDQICRLNANETELNDAVQNEALRNCIMCLQIAQDSAAGKFSKAENQSRRYTVDCLQIVTMTAGPTKQRTRHFPALTGNSE